MRRERLRRHWMDRPPLPTSPVPCSGIVGSIFGTRSYAELKHIAENDYRRFDSLSRQERDVVRQSSEATAAAIQRWERDEFFEKMRHRKAQKK